MWQRLKNRQGGFVFLVTLAAMAFLMLQLGINATRVRTVLSLQTASLAQQKAFYQANAGLEDGISQVMSYFRYGGPLTGGTCIRFQSENYDCYTLTIADGPRPNSKVVTSVGQSGRIQRKLSVTLNQVTGIPTSLKAFSQIFYVGSSYITPTTPGIIFGDGTNTYDSLFVNGDFTATKNQNGSFSVLTNYLRIMGQAVTGNGVAAATIAQPRQPAIDMPLLSFGALGTLPPNWTHQTCSAPCTVTGTPVFAGPTVVLVDGDLTLSNVTVAPQNGLTATVPVAYVATGNVTVEDNLRGTTNASNAAKAVVGVFAQGNLTLRQTQPNPNPKPSFNGLFYTASSMNATNAGPGGVDGTLTGVMVANAMGTLQGKSAPFQLAADNTVLAPFTPITSLAGPAAGISYTAP